jgi:hypothetical protein
MADFEGNHPLAVEQYRELFSLWHEPEDRMFAVPGVVSAAEFMPTAETARIWPLAAKSLAS